MGGPAPTCAGPRNSCARGTRPVRERARQAGLRAGRGPLAPDERGDAVAVAPAGAQGHAVLHQVEEEVADTPLGELPPFMRDVTFSAEVIPRIVVHELVHHQHSYTAGSTLLAQALLEGVAGFLTDRAVGCYPTASATYAYGDAREDALWAEFREAMHGTDFSGWLYNGGGGGERPDNLGYWMGYRIAEAYYERAADQQRAVHDLLHIRDFEALLAASGYPARFED